MRTMLRIARALATALFAIAAVLLAQSWIWPATVQFDSAKDQWDIASRCGKLILSNDPARRAAQQRLDAYTQTYTRELERYLREDLQRQANPFGHLGQPWQQPTLNLPPAPSLPPAPRDWGINYLWLVLPAAAALSCAPISRHLSAAIKRRRQRLGLCPQCGYDLRATPTRCPECGREVAPKSN